jgi:hypothetical protein
VLKLAKAVLGMDAASQWTKAARRAVCDACPHLIRGPADKCGLCNCFVAQKVKLASEICPDLPPRWPAESKLK